MKNAAVDIAELARFILTGLAATLGNMAAVWLARFSLPFEAALLIGIAAGLTISYLLSKWFAFGSRSWERAPREMARFLLVYCVSCGLYWTAAVAVRGIGQIYGFSDAIAETLGILIGAGAMMVTSYLGHRFFTYRTHHRAAASFDSAL